jgi:hypothetical protein
MKTRLTLLLVCIAFAGLRFTLPVRGLDLRDTFKDLAHVFVGGLFGAAIYATCSRMNAEILKAAKELRSRKFAATESHKERIDQRASAAIACAEASESRPWQLWAMAGGLTACEVVAALVRG